MFLQKKSENLFYHENLNFYSQFTPSVTTKPNIDLGFQAQLKHKLELAGLCSTLVMNSSVTYELNEWFKYEIRWIEFSVFVDSTGFGAEYEPFKIFKLLESNVQGGIPEFITKPQVSLLWADFNDLDFYLRKNWRQSACWRRFREVEKSITKEKPKTAY